MAMIRVLVVDDSPTVRGRLRDVLAADPELDVVGVAENGKQAIELCQRARPDVITMDMTLPVMNGLAATEYIMANCPTPILVVSASTNRAELFTMYDALAAGAVDVLEKPRGDASDPGWEQKLRATVKLVSRIAVVTHLRARLGARVEPDHPPVPPPLAGFRTGGYQVVAIGASTGGPAAVVEVLRALPPDYAIPVLLVQHICAPFGVAFADWLGRQLGRATSHARDGEPVAEAAGQVIMAPPGRHLIVRDGRLRLTTGPKRHSCRPSVDVLFESIAQEYPGSAAACLLTGMGRDGAAGLLALRQSGALTIAQDEASSVVYGMPREAWLLGAARHVMAPVGIGCLLERLAPMPAASDRLASKP
jgi:two-component system chemotaxis response regulator CheB